MKEYCKYLFIGLIVIINIGFIWAFLYKHDVSVELIDTIDYVAPDVEGQLFEIKTIDISGSDAPCLMAYGGRIKKIEYSPIYIFSDDWYLLRNSIASNSRSLDYSFFIIHPYYIEYEGVPDKTFIYRLPPEFSGINGFIRLMK